MFDSIISSMNSVIITSEMQRRKHFNSSLGDIYKSNFNRDILTVVYKEIEVSKEDNKAINDISSKIVNNLIDSFSFKFLKAK